jgi:kinesin family protein 18/19
MIKDLINVTNEVLDIREDPVKGIVVAGLSEMLVTSPDEVMQTMRRADQNRTVEPT